MDNLRTLLGTYKPERRQITGITALLVMGAVFETVALVLLVPIATAVGTGNDAINRTFAGVTIEASPSVLVVVALLATVAGLATRLVTAFAQSRTVLSVEARQRRRLYTAFMQADWEVQSAEPPGRFQWATSLTTGYADLLGIILNSLRFVINVAVMLVAAFVVSPIGAASILAVGVLVFLALRPLLRAARRAQQRALAARQRQDERVAEMVPLIGNVKAFGVGEAFAQRLRDALHAVLKEKRTAMVLAAVVTPIYQSIGLLIALGILGFATTTQLDIPALGAVALLLLRSLSSAQGIQNSLHKYAEYRPVLDLLEEWNERYEGAREEFGDVDIHGVESVTVRSLDYSYGYDDLAISGLDLALRPGDHVGLVGPSGAGKSTLATVLLRFRRPTVGEYRLNGLDAWSITPESFSREVAYVPQAPLILRGTVEENVTFLREGIDRDRVMWAVQQSGLSDWVSALPEGVDTVVGPDSHGFSGGQAQRLSIARALAGTPSMVVLDEPTSALDVDSEALITTALKGLPDDVIVVLIAHRMSTLRHCNRIVVLEDGRVTADGSAESTMMQSEFFRRAVEAGAFGTAQDHAATSQLRSGAGH